MSKSTMISVTLGVDVAAYSTFCVEVPRGVDPKEYLLTKAEELRDNNLFDVDWDTSCDLRIVRSRIIATDEIVVEGLVVEPRVVHTDAPEPDQHNTPIETVQCTKELVMTNKVKVTFGVDVPAYLTCEVEIPEGQTIQGYLREHGHELSDECEQVWEPDWENQGGLRAVAVRGDGDKTLVSDLALETCYHNRGMIATEVLNRHWDVIVQALPSDVVGQLCEVLKA